MVSEFALGRPWKVKYLRMHLVCSRLPTTENALRKSLDWTLVPESSGAPQLV
jgi:hypothetical protein